MLPPSVSLSSYPSRRGHPFPAPPREKRPGVKPKKEGAASAAVQKPRRRRTGKGGGEEAFFFSAHTHEASSSVRSLLLLLFSLSLFPSCPSHSPHFLSPSNLVPVPPSSPEERVWSEPRFPGHPKDVGGGDQIPSSSIRPFSALRSSFPLLLPVSDVDLLYMVPCGHATSPSPSLYTPFALPAKGKESCKTS